MKLLWFLLAAPAAAFKFDNAAWVVSAGNTDKIPCVGSHTSHFVPSAKIQEKVQNLASETALQPLLLHIKHLLPYLKPIIREGDRFYVNIKFSDTFKYGKGGDFPKGRANTCSNILLVQTTNSFVCLSSGKFEYTKDKCKTLLTDLTTLAPTSLHFPNDSPYFVTVSNTSASHIRYKPITDKCYADLDPYVVRLITDVMTNAREMLIEYDKTIKSLFPTRHCMTKTYNLGKHADIEVKHKIVFTMIMNMFLTVPIHCVNIKHDPDVSSLPLTPIANAFALYATIFHSDIHTRKKRDVYSFFEYIFSDNAERLSAVEDVEIQDRATIKELQERAKDSVHSIDNNVNRIESLVKAQQTQDNTLETFQLKQSLHDLLAAHFQTYYDQLVQLESFESSYYDLLQSFEHHLNKDKQLMLDCLRGHEFCNTRPDSMTCVKDCFLTNRRHHQIHLNEQFLTKVKVTHFSCLHDPSGLISQLDHQMFFTNETHHRSVDGSITVPLTCSKLTDKNNRPPEVEFVPARMG